MRHLLAAGIAAMGLLAGPIEAQELPFAVQEPVETLDELDTVVVYGGYAIPKMWKVSKGDHVMWVLGTGVPPPAGVNWRTTHVEAHVAESQLVLYPGWSTVDPDVGFFNVIALVPAAFKAAKNPDGKKLKDVLPADTYARWRVLKTKYVGKDDDIERWRPTIAIAMLQDKVTEKLRSQQPKAAAKPAAKPAASPPPTGPALRSVVDKAAKEHKVKVRTMPKVEREVKIKHVADMLKSLRETNVGDMKCFTLGLDYLERLIEYTDKKAGAVAQGNAAPEQDNAAAPRLEGCEGYLLKALRSGEIPDPAGIIKLVDNVQLQLKLATQQLRAEWIAAAQAALMKNKSTFAVLSMRQINGTDSYIAKLRELGYAVEEPGSVD
jgi:hypothetical protein